MQGVEVFTDGACLGNPGPGGYAAIVIGPNGSTELAGGYALTTNNRMELMACIVALESLPEKSKVRLTSDSKYVVDAMRLGWARGWKARGWKRGTGEPALNPDLWERLLAASARHQVQFEWVKGHSGHPENERCDELSVEWANREDLPEDPGYAAARASSP